MQTCILRSLAKFEVILEITCLIRQTWNRITENVFDGSTLVMADLITRVKATVPFPLPHLLVRSPATTAEQPNVV